MFFKYTLKNNGFLLFSHNNYESYCIHIKDLSEEANVLLNDLRKLEIRKIIIETVNLKLYTSHYSVKKASSL